jgi:hypothetical protein
MEFLMRISSINYNLQYEELIQNTINNISNPIKLQRIPCIEFYSNIYYPTIEVEESKFFFDSRRNQFRTKFRKYHRFNSKSDYKKFTEIMHSKSGYSLSTSTNPIRYNFFGIIFAIGKIANIECYYLIAKDNYDSLSILYKDKENFDSDIQLPIFTENKEFFTINQYNQIIEKFNS